MISAHIALQGFDASVHNGEQELADEQGKPTGEKAPVKILAFKDSHSQLRFHLIFSEEQFQTFAEQIERSASGIVRPSAEIPFFKRNGGIIGN